MLINEGVQPRDNAVRSCARVVKFAEKLRIYPFIRVVLKFGENCFYKTVVVKKCILY